MKRKTKIFNFFVISIPFLATSALTISCDKKSSQKKGTNDFETEAKKHTTSEFSAMYFRNIAVAEDEAINDEISFARTFGINLPFPDGVTVKAWKKANADEINFVVQNKNQKEKTFWVQITNFKTKETPFEKKLNTYIEGIKAIHDTDLSKFELLSKKIDEKYAIGKNDFKTQLGFELPKIDNDLAISVISAYKELNNTIHFKGAFIDVKKQWAYNVNFDTTIITYKPEDNSDDEVKKRNAKIVLNNLILNTTKTNSEWLEKEISAEDSKNMSFENAAQYLNLDISKEVQDIIDTLKADYNLKLRIEKEKDNFRITIVVSKAKIENDKATWVEILRFVKGIYGSLNTKTAIKGNVIKAIYVDNQNLYLGGVGGYLDILNKENGMPSNWWKNNDLFEIDQRIENIFPGDKNHLYATATIPDSSTISSNEVGVAVISKDGKADNGYLNIQIHGQHAVPDGEEGLFAVATYAFQKNNPATGKDETHHIHKWVHLIKTDDGAFKLNDWEKDAQTQDDDMPIELPDSPGLFIYKIARDPLNKDKYFISTNTGLVIRVDKDMKKDTSWNGDNPIIAGGHFNSMISDGNNGYWFGGYYYDATNKKNIDCFYHLDNTGSKLLNVSPRDVEGWNSNRAMFVMVSDGQGGFYAGGTLGYLVHVDSSGKTLKAIKVLKGQRIYEMTADEDFIYVAGRKGYVQKIHKDTLEDGWS